MAQKPSKIAGGAAYGIGYTQGYGLGRAEAQGKTGKLKNGANKAALSAGVDASYSRYKKQQKSGVSGGTKAGAKAVKSGVRKERFSRDKKTVADKYGGLVSFDSKIGASKARTGYSNAGKAIKKTTSKTALKNTKKTKSGTK